MIKNKRVFVLIAMCISLIIFSYSHFWQDLIAQDRCLDAGGMYQPQTASCDHNMHDVPYQKFDGIKYHGLIAGQTLTLEIIGQGDGYRLSEDGVVTLGELNTERGFTEDENATVYILNWREAKAVQRKFVKFSSNPLQLIALDKANNPDYHAILQAHQH